MANDSKVTSIWLSTGKRLDTSLGCVFTPKGTLVRTDAKKILVIPNSSIVAIETYYEDEKVLEEALNGQEASETKA